MSSTTLSTQKLVPGLPSTISVISLGAQSCGVLRDALNTGTGTKVFGVSLRLSKKGLMEVVALGTPETVFLISLVHDNPAQKRRKQASKAKPPPDPVSLSHILDNEHCLLAGFQMPRLALLLQRQASAHVYGVDLSTLHAKNKRKQVSAAELADRHLSNRVNQRNIHALWLRDEDDDICLRAWLSAW